VILKRYVWINLPLVFLFVLTACQSHSNSDPRPSAAPPTMGGADPSGGEGGRSTTEELKATVDQSLTDLRPLFERMAMFFASENASDRAIVKSIEFLRPQFPGTLFKKLDGMVQFFRQHPVYASGDCPAKNHHDSTDMSVTSDLHLCVSEKLTRYPVRELRRQVLSLLAHQVVHTLGIKDEKLAGDVQYWVGENRGVAVPARSLPAAIGDRVDTLSQVWQLFSSRLGEPQGVDRQRACEYVVQLRLAFEDLHLQYSVNSEDSLILVPEVPVRQMSQSVLDHLDVWVNHECVEDRVRPADPKKLLTTLLSFAEEFERFRQTFNVYVKGSAAHDAFPITPRPQSLISTLVADKDLSFQASKPVTVECRQGTNVRILRIDDPADTAYEFPISGGRLTIHQFRINSDGSVGLYLKFFELTNGSSLKVLASNADLTREDGVGAPSPAFFKVLGQETGFNLRVQINALAAIEIKCQAK
jgi:hypothetical protein